MPGTIVHQTRTATSTDAGAVYRISASCTYQGTLPDTGIFLLKVVSPSDPKDDTLERLCSPADFTTFGTSRDQAALSGGYYRTGTYTLSYNDVGYASSVWGELSSRINALVNDFDVFLTAFTTQPEGVDTIYPTFDQGVKNARIDTYKQRVVAVAAAEEARDTHQRTCRDIKQLELASVKEKLDQSQADLTALRTIRTVVDVLAAGYPASNATASSNTTTAIAALNLSAATSVEKSSITATLQAVLSSLQTANGFDSRLISEVQTPLAVLVSTLDTRVNDLTLGYSSAQSALAACDNEMSRLQGAVDEARRARDAALAAVREVCTDYVPFGDQQGTIGAELALLLGGY